MYIFYVLFIEVYMFLISHFPLLKYIEHDITCHLTFRFYIPSQEKAQELTKAGFSS